MMGSYKKIAAALLFVAGLGAAGATGAGLSYLWPRGVAADAAVSQTLSLPNVELIDQFGKVRPLRDDIAKDALVIVNFNFSTCESICPVGNVLMQQVDRQAPRPKNKSLRLLSITIDPRTDTPQVMRKEADTYAASDRWLWLTGSPAEIDKLLASVGARVSDVTLHTPLFLVGDADAEEFAIIRTQPEVVQLLDLIRRRQG